MLTLTPGSSCDVCAEEYGPHCLPNSIPCGHVLCASCCMTIAEKTAPKLSPACPFCRENFTPDSVRLIRLDFNTSGWTTPRRLPNIDTNPPDFASDAWNKGLMMADGCSRTRLDARRLEAKVAKVAAKKCSVEEVTHLHKELQEWLMSDPKDDDESRAQISSLTLSAALLRAILTNQVAHSESSRLAKNVEANLKTKLDDLDLMNSKLDSELKRQRTAYSQKAQECQSLRQEMSRMKIVPATQPAPPPPTSSMEARHLSPSPPPMPTTYTSSASSAARFSWTHTRSSSLFSRPTTPAPHLARAQTPGPVSPPRPYTPAPPRSQTPGPTRSNSISFASANAAARLEKSPTRAQTPVPPSRANTTTPTPTRHVSMTAASTPLRSHTPAPVQTTAPAPRARRLSHPSAPPLAARSLSEEKYEAQALHQRWLPNTFDDKVKYMVRPPSRSAYTFRGYRVSVEEEDDD